jgi:hypothetical protein
MTDDAIRERHGVKTQPDETYEEVILREREQTLTLSVGTSKVAMTQWQARYLAAKLYRLARRIRQRGEAETNVAPITQDRAA